MSLDSKPLYLELPEGPAQQYAKIEYLIDLAGEFATYIRRDARIRNPTPFERQTLEQAVASLLLAVHRL